MPKSMPLTNVSMVRKEYAPKGCTFVGADVQGWSSKVNVSTGQVQDVGDGLRLEHAGILDFVKFI